MPYLEDFKMYTVLAIHCSHLATVQTETSYMILINRCDRRITHLSDLDISCSIKYICKISFTFRMLPCTYYHPKGISKEVNRLQYTQTKRYISITKKSDTSITVIYHAISLTVLYI